MADLSAYKFSADLLKGSAGDFKMFLKSRYGYKGTVKGLTASEIDKLVNAHYKDEVLNGDDEVTEVTEADEPTE